LWGWFSALDRVSSVGYANCDTIRNADRNANRNPKPDRYANHDPHNHLDPHAGEQPHANGFPDANVFPDGLRSKPDPNYHAALPDRREGISIVF
jgi:hypothetical protein